MNENLNNHDCIYVLCESESTPFYVGRTNAWSRRYKEHRNAARTGAEAKYQHIRKLWADGKDFELVVIDENPGKNYERYYHYMLGVEFELTNMRLGDTLKAQNVVMRDFRKRGSEFTGPEDFLTTFDFEVALEKARMKAARTTAKIRNPKLSDGSTTLFSGDFENPNKKFISPWMREKNLLGRKKYD